jgi:hypothetical protein
MAAAEPGPHQRACDVEQADEPDRPAAELERRDRRPEGGQADGLVGDVGRQVQADEGSRPTARSVAIGFWKMPKLWRAPIPIDRITAPQITGTQKLRSRSA